jgi:uncharacterized protein (DUF58 family)
MRRRYHLHPPGLLYLLLVVVLGIAAANRPGNLLVWVFAAMLAGVLVSGILSGPTLMRLSASRLLPRTARAGEPLVVGYSVTQRSRLWPAFALHAREREAPPGSRAFVQHVGPGETVVAEAIFWPERRGRLMLPSFRLETSFPFGLIRKSIRFDERGECLVLPRTVRLRADVLPELAGAGRSGASSSLRVGPGTDFVGLREYRPGDPMRHVAWRRSAALGTLAVTERTVDAPPRIHVVLDLRRATDALRVDPAGRAPRDLEEDAIVLAASLLADASRASMETRLSVLGVDAGTGGARGGIRHLNRQLASLAAIDLDAPRRADDRIPPVRDRAATVVVHVDRADLSVSPSAMHVGAAQLGVLSAGGRP